MFRGAELTRLLAGVVMLVVLYMLIVRAKDVSTWRWLTKTCNSPTAASAENSPKQPEKADSKAPPPVKPAEPTGPTDEDPDEAETAKEEYQALTDGTLALGPEEMEAYDRMVEWVKNQSFARLDGRAKTNLWYTDLHDSAKKYRGELVALDLDIRRARDIGKNRYGVDLHEIWGVTDESRGRFYVAVVLDYPKGMPTGWDIRARARFAGYFLKLQGYESADAKPGQAPDRAPLLIGRLEWEPPVELTEADNSDEWFWGTIALGVVLAILGGRFLIAKLFPRKKTAAPRLVSSETGEAIPLDVWLERPAPMEEEEGNNIDGENEYQKGRDD